MLSKTRRGSILPIQKSKSGLGTIVEKSESKNYPRIAARPREGHPSHIWPYMDHIWPYMDHIWPYMGHIWSIYGHIWPIYGHIWVIYGSYMAIYGLGHIDCHSHNHDKAHDGPVATRHCLRHHPLTHLPLITWWKMIL